LLRCSVAAAQLLKPICGVILQIDARFVLHAAVTTSPHRSMFNLPCLAACLGQRPEGCTTPNGNKRRTAAASDLRPQWLRANPYCLRRRQHSNSGTVQARLPVAFLVNYLAARLRHSGSSWVGGCPLPQAVVPAHKRAPRRRCDRAGHTTRRVRHPRVVACGCRVFRKPGSPRRLVTARTSSPLLAYYYWPTTGYAHSSSGTGIVRTPTQLDRVRGDTHTVRHQRVCRW